MTKNYKGFAYTKASDKYHIVYGDTQQEIMDKLTGWNKARADEMKYVYCNIGTYSPELDKYIKYQKFDVATGKNISPLALKIPSVSKEEFERITKEFKEYGAKFNSTYKKWYISPDNRNMEYFQQYLADKEAAPQEEQREQKADKVQPESRISLEQRHTEALKPAAEPEKEVHREEQTGSQTEYAPELIAQAQRLIQTDLQEMRIAQEKLSILQGLVEKDLEINGKVSDLTNQLLDVYHAEILSQDINGKPWVIYRQPEQAVQKTSVQENPEAEEQSTGEQKESVLEASTTGEQTEEVLEYTEGDRIDVYRAKMIASPDNPEKIVISGISPVNGVIEEISYDVTDEVVYRVKGDDTFITHVYQSEIYSAQQANVLLRAEKDKLPPEKFDVLAQPVFNSAQMEELRMAFKEGLSIEQVKQFAAPSLEAWKMDLCKYGMQYGLNISELQEIKAEDWFEGRKEVNGLIAERREMRMKELEKQGFTADSKMIKSMERLDHLTHRTNNLKDICNAFKEGIFKDSEAGNIVDYLGREFQQQEMQQQMLESLVPEQ